MSKKGLSLEEKKARMLQLFHEKGEFYQLKDLEKIAPKEKGITANTVKDVVQALIDDAAIDTDKIGGSHYFWSFPSKVLNEKKRKLEEMESELENSSKKLKLNSEALSKAKAGKENIDTVKAILKQVEELKKRKESLLKEVQSNSSVDPEKMKKMKEEVSVIKEAANRWTDNIFSVKSWCKNKFLLEDSVINKQFGIRDDLDYIE